jgi:hypothetical protein
LLRVHIGASKPWPTEDNNTSKQQQLERKKSVTFDDGVKPGVETTASKAVAAASLIMATQKTRTETMDTDHLTSFKPGWPATIVNESIVRRTHIVCILEELTDDEAHERQQRLKGLFVRSCDRTRTFRLVTDPNQPPVTFVIHRNLRVLSKIVDKSNSLHVDLIRTARVYKRWF